MKKIAIVDGNFRKDATEAVKNVWVNGELQNRISEFGKEHTILDIKPIDGRTFSITYEE